MNQSDREVFYDIIENLPKKIAKTLPIILGKEKNGIRMEELKDLLDSEEDELNCKVAAIGEFEVTKLFSHLRSNLFEWLPVNKYETVLLIGEEAGCFAGVLSQKCNKVICLETTFLSAVIAAYRSKRFDNVQIIYGTLESAGEYLKEETCDYILFTDAVSIHKREKTENSGFVGEVKAAKKFLTENGRIVFTAGNCMGMKYWAGCRDNIQNAYFAGIEGYAKTDGTGMPTKNELDEMIRCCALKHHMIYYPYPDHLFPTSIFSDSFLPQEGELTKNAFSWEKRMVLFNEVDAWNHIIRNHMFVNFSNSFLVVMTNCEESLKDFHLFTKYSNDRNESFAIRTDIYAGNDGLRHVRKISLSEKGINHLKNMVRWKKELGAVYADTNIKINEIKEIERGVEFEYLNGRSLLGILEDDLKRDDFEDFYKRACQFIEILREKNQEEFVITPEFRRVFGEAELPGGLKSGKLGNIDLIFSNVLVHEDVMEMIDYEWVFDFPIPVNFIIYRSIDHFFKGPRGMYNYSKLYQTELFERLDIDEKQCAAYEEMEKNFQEYICSGFMPLRKIGVTKPDRMVLMEPQIYLDFGKGFRRQNSYYASQTVEGCGSMEIRIGVTPNMRAVRVDPANVPCIVQIREAVCGGKEEYIPFYSVNGRQLAEGIILYNTIDSQIIFSGLADGTTFIRLKLQISELGEPMMDAIEENLKE